MRSVLFVSVCFLLAAALLFGASCANRIPPNGGPRDSIPPRLLSATPPDSSVNFKSNQIVLSFDEYIDLQDVPNNLLFTPLFDKRPKVEVGGRNITISFQDSLEANTTYIFNFGSALRDFNEGNVLKDFTYTFSTGPVLDSAEFRGKVILAQTGKIDSTLTVVLHRNLKDSAVQNQTPRYAVRVDQQGNFRFRNLAPGRYAVYALGDAGTGRRYQDKSKLFAFADSAITVRAGNDKDTSAKPLVLYAYAEVQPKVPSIGGNLFGRNVGPAPPAAANRLVFSTNLTGNQQDLLNDLIFSFATPIRNFDSAQLILSTDSTFNRVNYTHRFDSLRKQLTLRSQWREGTRYNLVLNRDFAFDTVGRRLLKSDTLFFTTKKAGDYGAFTLRLKNTSAGANPVVLLVQNEQVVFSASLRSGSIRQRLFNPGEYEIRILDDRNNNGQWDPGDFFNGRRQPELVRILDRKLTVKADSDTELEL